MQKYFPNTYGAMLGEFWNIFGSVFSNISGHSVTKQFKIKKANFAIHVAHNMYVDKSKLDLDHNKLSYPRTHFRMSN
jgi:hypothetical protein